LQLSWPSAITGFVLEHSKLLPSDAWTLVPAPPTIEGDRIVVSVEVSTGADFYRLRKP
jgi:hypothetical protein